jgi:hypothetical protein
VIALALLSAFWLAAGILGFAYVGYPLTMALLARLRPQRLHAPVGAHPGATGSCGETDRAPVRSYMGMPAPETAENLHSATPRIDVLLVAHNAEREIEAKLRNLLELDYPHDALRIHLVCDGCDDATEQRARALASPRLRVVAHAQRRG